MMGTLATAGYPGSWSGPFGLFLLSAYDNTNSLTWWLQNPGNGTLGSGDLIQSQPSAALTNCAGMGNNGNFLVPDMMSMPPFDIYGTPTSGTAYSQATLTLPNGTTSQPYTGMVYDPTALTNGNTGSIAAWNATDNIASIIRSQSIMQPVTLYAIGYTGDGGTDTVLLNRVANTQASSSYNPNQTSGGFIQVNSAAELGGAFSNIAGQLLRLSK
jgi:hypothetical protein